MNSSLRLPHIRIVFPILCLAIASSLKSQDFEREIPLPLVTLVQPPNSPSMRNVTLAEKQVAEIEKLIGELANIEKNDIYLNRTLWGSVFVPIGKFNTFGDWTNESVNASDAVKKLIQFGPTAIPFLLEGLDDATPTQIVINSVKTEGAIAGGMAFDEVLHGNPANPNEHHILRLHRLPWTSSTQIGNSLAVEPEIESYRIKIGDVCFVILGQIVGRKYEIASSTHVKSLGILICSPVHKKRMRVRLRNIWKTSNPKQKLLESLLLDFSTRGMVQPDSLDNWTIGNNFQIEASKRLLFYFPEVAVPILVDRLDQLRTTGEYVEDSIANGLSAYKFVHALAWSKDKTLRTAFERLKRRAKHKALLEALEMASRIKLKEPDNNALDRSR